MESGINQVFQIMENVETEHGDKLKHGVTIHDVNLNVSVYAYKCI